MMGVVLLNLPERPSRLSIEVAILRLWIIGGLYDVWDHLKACESFLEMESQPE
jgi:hypothetical protein